VPSVTYGWGCCDQNNRKNRRLRSSILIESKSTSLLVDMSPDLRQQMLDNNVRKVDAVIFTHAHYDHVNGINELRPMYFGSDHTLNVYGSEITIGVLKKAFYYLFEDVGVALYKPYISTNVIKDSFSIGDISGICFEQNHGYVSSTGIRIGNFAYSTDVFSFSNESLAKLEGLDTWIVGCIAKERKTNHANLDTVVEWVEKLKPKMTFLTHMGISMDYDSLARELPPNIHPLYDQMQMTIKPESANLITAYS
jgi:phosphoribosyl 1,2-cyclic phosphate phosphodiesterase